MTPNVRQFFAGALDGKKRHVKAMHHDVSIALMQFLAQTSIRLGVSKHVYVVGGAVRNWVLGENVKDVDVVIDSVALGGRKDSEWFAKELQRAIPTHTSLTTNNYGVAILSISGDWEVGGQNLKGEVIEIANARTESYAKDTYKPNAIAPATIEDDVYRREFSFNSLLWRLYDLANGPDKAEILDLTGCGLRDLQEGVMRCPPDPDKTFSDDPSRMIRAIKFLLKYGFKIAPEVEASIRRNKEKIRNIPGSHLSNMIITLFYDTGVGKRALIEMDKLGLLDVIRSIATTDKPFREALANWAERKADVAFLFDLMDLGMPVGKSMNFLNQAQKDRVRDVTAGMTVDEGMTFVAVLEQPGKIIDMPGLIQEFGLRGLQIRDLMLEVRTVLLDDPVLVASPRRWESRIRTSWGQHGGGNKTARTFTLNPGDPVLFGKFKNKRGIIKDFGVSDKGDPTVVIETPTGKIQVLNLFKIRDPQPTVDAEGGVVADLAGHIPEYERLTQEYNVMGRTSKQTIDEDTDIDGWGEYRKTEPIKAVRMNKPFEVETPEGTMQGKEGDWLAEGIEGERWVIDADIFSKTYEKTGLSKEAGWWDANPRDQAIVSPVGMKGFWGDSAADVIDVAIRKINDQFLDVWGRNAYAHELDAGWNFSMGPYRKGWVHKGAGWRAIETGGNLRKKFAGRMESPNEEADFRRLYMTVAAYKNKKEVKKQDGGTMTVYEYSDRQIANRNRDKAKQVEKLRGNIDKLRAQYHKDLKEGV